MMENYQVRFLGEGEAVMSLPYPTGVSNSAEPEDTVHKIPFRVLSPITLFTQPEGWYSTDLAHLMRQGICHQKPNPGVRDLVLQQWLHTEYRHSAE